MGVRTWPCSAVALLAAALAAVGCASASGIPGGAGMAPRPASPAGTSRAGAPGCGPFPPRHAWAVEVTATGRIAWQTPLAARGTDSLTGLAPLVAGPVAVFAQDGTVHGLRLADGHPLWAWHGGQAVYGMWRWGGLVAVLTDQVSDHARITGLDAATGAVRWVLRVPGQGLLGSQVPTGDGYPTVRLVSRGAATGKPLWARPLAIRTAGPQPVLRLAGQAIVQTAPAQPHRAAPLLSYNLATGRPAWRARMPTSVEAPPVPAAGGLLIQPADPGYACAWTG